MVDRTRNPIKGIPWESIDDGTGALKTTLVDAAPPKTYSSQNQTGAAEYLFDGSTDQRILTATIPAGQSLTVEAWDGFKYVTDPADVITATGSYSIDCRNTRVKFTPTSGVEYSIVAADDEQLILSRYFTELSKAAGQYYSSPLRIAGPGRTDIRISQYVAVGASNNQLLQEGAALVRIASGTLIQAWTDTTYTNVDFVLPEDISGQLNDITVTFINGSSDIALRVNGVDYTGTAGGPFDYQVGFQHFFGRWLGNYYSGIIGDVSVMQDGLTTSRWSMSQEPGVTTIVDTVGTNDLSVINVPNVQTTEFSRLYGPDRWSDGSITMRIP